MNKSDIISCKCDICVGMCQKRPCWGTPEEIEKIMDAGHSNKLMLDYWCRDDDDIYIVSPAIIGYEKRNAPFIPHGQCVFLKDSLCMLHDKDLKPSEGALALCKAQRDNHKIGERNLHKNTALSWKSKKGLEIVRRFENEMMEG